MEVTLSTLNKLGYEPDATVSSIKMDKNRTIVSSVFLFTLDVTSSIGTLLHSKKVNFYKFPQQRY